LLRFVQFLCLILFFLLVVLPSLYGFHMYVLMFLAHRRRKQVRAAQRQAIERYQRETPEDRWPRITTQLPLYNEVAVARRVIEAAARMDYPAGRHEVQVLDDSTDETRAVVDQVAAELRAAGRDVQVVRRPTRAHYKAGALAHGLSRATGELVAVFDADFVPDPSFLRRLVPLIAQRTDVCCVQGRWGHLNARETWITEGLSLGLDMHFAIEQGSRAWNGLLMNFNGTAGIWRKTAIDDPRVGGWSGDTITEDLDLSYRAQLAGWKMLYCVDAVCPAELPADVNGLKTQQRRWAIGTMQTARKLLPAVWRSRLTFVQKVEATIHMTQYAIAVPMILVALMGRLLPLVFRNDVWPAWIQWLSGVFLLAALAPCVAYINASRVLGGGTPGPLRILKLIVLGLGLCVNNGVAVITGLVQRGGEFVRTPKSGSIGARKRGGAYSGLRSRLWIFELLLGAFCLAQWAYFLPHDGVGATFLLLYAIGLILLGWQSRPHAAREQVLKTASAPTAGLLPALPAGSLTPALPSPASSTPDALSVPTAE
jgi:cellulose synthase/poly-beta-1,6-N-acetylglucosamine synthase-like glycosyltransferase